MELRQLITFRTIVEVGGFKRAAERLDYAQSSITTHIKQLEKELGSPLFDRLGINISLTQTGRRFLPYALDMIQLYTESKEAVLRDDEVSGPLTIGASESLMIYWMPELMMDFMKEYPKIDLTLKSLDYPDVTSQLKRGDIDVALLVETSHWNPPECRIQKLKDEKLILVQSTNNQTAKSEQTMLYTEKACSWRPIFENRLSVGGTKSFFKVELPSVEAIKKSVLCGLGISLLPLFTVEEELAKGDLVELPTDMENHPIGIYAAFHQNKWISANLSAFLNKLREKSASTI